MRIFMLLAVVTAILSMPIEKQASAASAPESQTRQFPAQKCQYTLPGKDWSWVDQNIPNVLFSARNSAGFVVGLGVMQVPQHLQLDHHATDEIEKRFYASFPEKKRGGHFVIFKFLSFYQYESMMEDGETAVRRLVLANGYAYMLFVVGGKQPVELDPKFEDIMNGFSFTEPPVLPAGKSFFSTIESAVPIAICCIGIIWRIRRARAADLNRMTIAADPRPKYATTNSK